MNRGLIPLALLLAACSSNPEPEAPAPSTTPAVVAPPVTPPPAATSAFDGVGTYDFRVEFDGQAQTGVLAITKQSDGKLGGTLTGQNGDSFSLTTVTMAGRKMTVVGTIPGGPELNMTLNFEDNDKFAGTVAVQGMSLPVTGARKKS